MDIVYCGIVIDVSKGTAAPNSNPEAGGRKFL
jgi:hypothetical protein